jgi:hypothetical protein
VNTRAREDCGGVPGARRRASTLTLSRRKCIVLLANCSLYLRS